MTWVETFRTGLRAVRSHALRSMLTVLGILIGIAAVILTVGLGLGSQQAVGARIASLGSNLLIVSPGSSTSTGGIRGGFGSSSTLTAADAVALASTVNAPDIAGVAPEKSSSLSLVSATTNWTTSVVGTTPSWLSVRSRSLSAGSFITNADQNSMATHIVLGSSTASQLLPDGDAVVQQVTISGVEFTVVGVLTSAGSNTTSNLDDSAIVPLSTSANTLIGGSNRNSVSTIYLQAGSADQLSAAYQEAQSLLLNLHNITTSTAADFTVSSQQALLSTATSVTQTLTVLLTGIAALSLLVGGIGVMNIMLVSVTERTREIGLRKALGAPPAAIRRQFLVEATVLGFAGGLMGAALGIAGAKILPSVLSTPIIVSPAAVIGSIAIAISIGVTFGVYPASRAARLAPIDALRSD